MGRLTILHIGRGAMSSALHSTEVKHTLCQSQTQSQLIPSVPSHMPSLSSSACQPVSPSIHEHVCHLIGWPTNPSNWANPYEPIHPYELICLSLSSISLSCPSNLFLFYLWISLSSVSLSLPSEPSISPAHFFSIHQCHPSPVEPVTLSHLPRIWKCIVPCMSLLPSTWSIWLPLVMSCNTLPAMLTNPSHFQCFKLIVMPMALYILWRSLTWPQTIWMTPRTLGQILISSHQSLISALGHPSLLQCSGLVPALNGHLGIHSTCDGAKICLQFPSNPESVSPYSN